MRILTGLMAVTVGAYCAVGYFGLNYAKKLLNGMPELKINDFISPESSKIYDGNGTLITEIGTYYRDNIVYSQCPEALIDAFLSIEDSRYFEHNGFDIPRFSKAAIETVINHNTQGGSTFTMQLVKNTYFSIDSEDGSSEGVEREATYEYKAQQIILAMELEQYLNKEQIFELYVNKLNFGGRIRGIQKAAEYYFGKEVTELNLSECAMLAGIVNLPNGYNPYNYLEDATIRRNEVLGLMLQHGYIDQDEFDLASSIKVEDLLVGEDKLNIETTAYGAYIDAVIEEVQKMTGFDPVTTGMNIYTALDPVIQDTIEAIENEETYIT
ncbi:MAG: penicillin-binding protein, partial [Solobacterium sp.]|nr:penicillin-binding protein [Solobacterium sp.]